LSLSKQKYDMEKTDYILNHCCSNELQQFVTTLEERFSLTIVKEPSLGLTMIRAEDSVENQEFYLGEALTTDCEVSYNDITGYGICLGDEPVRAYCIAVTDALLLSGLEIPELLSFLAEQEQKINLDEKIEYNHVQRTRVDFKMMEQA